MTNAVKYIPPASVTEDELRTQTIYQRFSGTIIHPADATTIDLMNAVEISGALEFWGDTEEDQYTENDGDAI